MSDWEDIKTAPTGRRILILANNVMYAAQWVQNFKTGHVAWSVGDVGGGDRMIVESPTLWHELPDEPTQGKSDE